MMSKSTSSKKSIWKGLQRKASDAKTDRALTSQDKEQKVKKK